jgi:hypothetical protein
LLLDDAQEQRNEEALSLEQPEPRRPHALGAAVTPPTIVMAPVLFGQPMRPMLTGQMH